MNENGINSYATLTYDPNVSSYFTRWSYSIVAHGRCLYRSTVAQVTSTGH